MLTSDEIRFILDKIHPGFGYSDNSQIFQVQTKLSIILQATSEKEAANQAPETDS